MGFFLFEPHQTLSLPNIGYFTYLVYMTLEVAEVSKEANKFNYILTVGLKLEKGTKNLFHYLYL